MGEVSGDGVSRPGTGNTEAVAAPGEGARVPARFVALLDEFRARLDDRLDGFFREKEEAFADRDGSHTLVEGIRRLVEGGGKRLRPALVYFSYRSSGGRSEDRVMPLAMATELLHTYLLIHDDIMDRSDLRRGQPTAHVLFSDRHRSEGWPGDPEHHGRSVALLLGDLAHSWAVELYHRVPSPEDGRRSELDGTFSSMCEEVVLGQYLETMLPYRGEVREEELLEVMRLKSGRYSVERPLELGALLAGAGPGRLRSLRRYGRAVGQAFQLQDDILGTFGDSERAGKPGGVDLVEGKMTLLVHSALRTASSEQAAALRSVLSDPDPDREALDRARAIIRETGSLGRVRGLVRERLEEALAAVEEGIDDDEGRAFFTGLPRYLMSRDR